MDGEWSWKEKVNGLKRDERKKYRHGYDVGSSCAHSRVFFGAKGDVKLNGRTAGGDSCAVQPTLM